VVSSPIIRGEPPNTKEPIETPLATLRRQVAEINADPQPTTKTNPIRGVVIVRALDALTAVAVALDKAEIVAVDVETSNLDYRTGEVVGIGIATNDDVWYVPLAHRIEETGQLRPDQIPVSIVVDKLGFNRRRFVVSVR